MEARWQRELRRRGVDPAKVENPLCFSDEMQEAARRAAGQGMPVEKLRSLQRYLFDEDRFPFDYSSRGTHDAERAFETRRGNCVSFTTLFLSLARPAGLPGRSRRLR